ncbi:TRAP transporter substrate-binding protein [Sinomicrobium weinanense]|uniref:TRAP transporter substrate-binding protein n=1 Tax=Sinomicrobium weinanense TaxID=2842200 RepID=A0A926JPN7_9FLAO|nr:TRAP transporter substrate-binding protein [Sinomicrobium weinanense]MBC9795165.1 TRAP transporter substrate-binding protein [Sinomicrobium weinanense]MBU3121942.1 TRAP transporter substrate-binding protein [Sinomicrobium weinanense]
MIRKHRVIKYITCVIFLAFSISCQDANKVKVIKLGHGLDASHPVHEAMMFMAERLAEKSGGSMKIKIYPSQQLGTERECLELLQIGSLGMTKVSVGVLENFVPDLKLFGLPFLFRDKKHAHKVLDGEIGRKLLDASIGVRLKGMAFYDAGSRSFYTKRPVNKPEDLKGLKLRVMESQTAIDMVRNLGGSPTPISWGELYTSLQQGIVDGAENNLPSFYLSHHFEVCKYYIMDEHTTLPDMLLISTTIWNSLNDQQKTWMEEAARESVAYERKIWEEAENHALEEIKKAGVEVIYPDKEPFREKVSGMYEIFKQDPHLKEIIETIQAE